MKMNKKANMMMGFVIMFAVLFGATILYPHIEDLSGYSRIDLDCTNSSISNTNMAMCLVVDTIPPGFIIVAILVGIGFVVGVFI